MPPQMAKKSYNIKALVNNIELVFKTRSIESLNKPTYEFITGYMGFIAHYNLLGFQECYRDLRDFCAKLQTSEYSTDPDYNLQRANWYENKQEDGQTYNDRIAQTIRGMVAVARRYSQQVDRIFTQLEMEQDFAEVKRILGKYGLSNLELSLKDQA